MGVITVLRSLKKNENDGQKEKSYQAPKGKKKKKPLTNLKVGRGLIEVTGEPNKTKKRKVTKGPEKPRIVKTNGHYRIYSIKIKPTITTEKMFGKKRWTGAIVTVLLLVYRNQEKRESEEKGGKRKEWVKKIQKGLLGSSPGSRRKPRGKGEGEETRGIGRSTEQGQRWSSNGTVGWTTGPRKKAS